MRRSFSAHGLAVRHRLGARLGDESGMALVMALGIMLVLVVTLTTVITFTAAGARDSSRVNAGQKATALAEAGISNALAVLNQTYSAGNVDFYSPSSAGKIDPATLIPPPGRNTAYPGSGDVTWSGTYCMAASASTDPVRAAAEAAAGCNPATDYGTWRIKGTGSVANPTGPAAPVTRTVRARIQAILPSGTPPSSDLWNWIFSGKGPSPAGVCDTVLGNSVEVSSPLYVTGNLCLENSTAKVVQPTFGGARVGQKNRLTVGGFLRNDQTGNNVGANGTLGRLTQAFIGGSFTIPSGHTGACSYKADDSGGTWNYKPCADNQNVFVDAGELVNGALPTPPVTAPLIAPDQVASCPSTGNCIDLNQWYTISHPGPRNPCAIVSGTPPTFDNDTTRDVPQGGSLTTVQNLTPSTSSYVCRTVAGELSWNHVSKLLTVKNPVYFDGSIYIDTGGLATYSGRGTIFVSGTVAIKNGQLCAIRNSAGTGCDFDNWDPNVAANGDALAIAAFGNASNGGHQDDRIEGATGGIGIQIKNADYQGLLYARADVDIVTTARAQGPIVTPSTVRFGQSTFGTFPPLSILPTGAPGTPTPPATLGVVQDFSGG